MEGTVYAAQFGVDEAGKGPVLGPMVAACVVCDPAMLPEGIDDSKRLSAGTRETIAKGLREEPGVRIGVARVTTDRIDDSGTDMNTLTVDAHAQAIATVLAGSESEQYPLSGVVDGADTNANRFARRVADSVDRQIESESEIEIDAEHGADETYTIVGAASVVAKVERDATIEELRGKYGDVGSGYPGDPTTREFLCAYVDEHGQLPDCARASWQTSKDVLRAAEQSSLDSF